jgi:transposase
LTDSSSALVGQDAPIDDVGQASLERPAGLGGGLGLAELAQVVAAAGSGVAGLADRDGVQGGVELAVAAGVEPAGDRKLNHALYMMAMVQVRRPSAGQAYYRRKLAEGKSPKEALRCLKRRLSDAVYRCLVADQAERPVAMATS